MVQAPNAAGTLGAGYVSERETAPCVIGQDAEELLTRVLNCRSVLVALAAVPWPGSILQVVRPKDAVPPVAAVPNQGFFDWNRNDHTRWHVAKQYPWWTSSLH